MHLQAFGLPMPRVCVVRERAGRRHEVQRRHRERGHQDWEIGGSKEGEVRVQASTSAAGILYL